MGAATRRCALVLLAVLLLVGLPLLLHEKGGAGERAWRDRCAAQGGAVWSEPAATANPLVVHTGHPLLSCIGRAGDVLSEWD